MGVLRFEPKRKPLEFVAITHQRSGPQSALRHDTLRIRINQAEVMVPPDVDDRTLQRVIKALRQA